MVGNAHDAAVAYEHCLVGDETYMLSDMGTTRKVYLINDVVYKVGCADAENLWEYNNRNAFSSVPGVAIPKMALYGEVLAMEYIDGDPAGQCNGRWIWNECDCEGTETDMPIGMLETLSDLGWDFTMGNAVARDGVFYLVDLA
jgi:hypothetical protein